MRDRSRRGDGSRLTDLQGPRLSPATDRRPPRLLLVGGWTAPYVDMLGLFFTLVDTQPSVASPLQVDWLLASAESGTAESLRDLAQTLRDRASRGARVAVVDPQCRWPAHERCDVYLAGDVEPGQLSAALWLASNGFAISRHAEPSVHRREPSTVLTDRGALTEREVELLQALCAGLGNGQIARELNISRSTVEYHLTKIFKKLDVSSRAEAIVRVQRHGIWSAMPNPGCGPRNRLTLVGSPRTPTAHPDPST